METRRLRLKLDENLSRHLRHDIEALGHDVDTAADESLIGKPDDDVAKAARDAGRMLLTLDLDFADLRRFRPGTHPGIVVLRPDRLGPSEVRRLLLTTLSSINVSEMAECLVIVQRDRIRVRRPATDDGI